MAKVQSLADYLGTPDAAHPDPGVDAPSTKASAKDFAREFLASPEYRASLMRRVMLDELPQSVECLLYHYAYGKPVERIAEVPPDFDLDDLSMEQLEANALQALEFVRRCRAESSQRYKASDAAPDEDDSVTRQVH